MTSKRIEDMLEMTHIVNPNPLSIVHKNQKNKKKLNNNQAENEPTDNNRHENLADSLLHPFQIVSHFEKKICIKLYVTLYYQ
jgi:hypothetical protein